MACKNVLLFFLFQTSAAFAADETPTFYRSSYFRTLENKQLKGYVVKKFDSPSMLSCGQQCMRNEWCASTNYKMSSTKDGKGTCELNKHDISLISENTNFHDEQAVTFSRLLKGCLITSCLNGGSCLPDEEKQTYSCLCKPPWSTGDKCAWFLHGNFCYHIIDIPAPGWSDARSLCQNLGGDLPIVSSAGENNFTLGLLRKQDTVKREGTWLGLYRKADTKFYWIDDTALEGQYSAWASREPSNVQEKCVQMHGLYRPGKWNDVSCSPLAEGGPVICQKKSI